jgi:peptidoglycan/LPS O-acetylase OafA/YrhL
MPWSYRPALDGVRSVAVYLVLLFHAGIQDVAGGFIGVDLFFVLSGFLVSNVILSEIDETGGLRLGRFYARRVRRLLPAAVVVVVATSVLFLLLTSVVRRLPLIGDAQSALLYVANWRFLLAESDYFAADSAESPFLHFWSLAIEEQFYLLFPVLLLLLVRLSRRWRRAPAVALSVLFLASLTAQVVWAAVDPSWAYYGTDARLYQLLAGVLLALALRAVAARPSASVAGLGAAVGLLGMLALSTSYVPVTPSVRGILATALSVLLIGGITVAENGLLARLLALRLPVYLGRISYGTYLWHWPVILVIGELLTVRPLVVAVLAMAVSTGLAAASFEILELPIRSARPLRRLNWSTLGVGVACSLIAAVAVVPPVLDSERKPRLTSPPLRAGATALLEQNDTGATEDQLRTRVPDDIDWNAVVNDEADPPECDPQEVGSCTVRRGTGPHLVLVGDSHAMMMVPMFRRLAEEHDLTLTVNAKGGCPWQADLVNKSMTRKNQERCEERRENWYDEVLPELDPDVVVLISDLRDDESKWQGVLTRRGDSDESLQELYRSTSRDTLATFRSLDARVLHFDSIIRTNFNPVGCLSRARVLGDCVVAYPTSEEPASPVKPFASRRSGVHTVDVNPVVCPTRPECLPMQGDEVVWKDRNHLTTTFLTSVRGEVWQRIQRSGVLRGL